MTKVVLICISMYISYASVKAVPVVAVGHSAC